MIGHRHVPGTAIFKSWKSNVAKHLRGPIVLVALIIYGAQASAGIESCATAVIDMTVAVGSAARLDLAMMLVVAGTSCESRPRHAARFLFSASQDSSRACFAVSLGAASPD